MCYPMAGQADGQMNDKWMNGWRWNVIYDFDKWKKTYCDTNTFYLIDYKTGWAAAGERFALGK